ncbi:MAG: acyltransferase family protein [Phenylobacterium sp.]|nr:acyltransferase family protein [Phenylobacterium sp.]
MDGRVNEGGGERLHGLDAVRGFALIGGVVLHATMSFFPGAQMWIVKDAAESVELGVVFYVLHMFRMAVFFLLAGFFGRMLLQRRGVGGFMKDRFGRIVLPFAMFWPIVFPAIVAALIWGAVQAAGGQPLPAEPPPNPFTVEAFPLTHLWFLYVLVIFYAAALLLRGLVVAVDRGGALRNRLDRPVRFVVENWAPILLALPTAALLSLSGKWPLWFGVHTPDTGLIPNVQALAIYGLAFGLGWLVNRQTALLDVWRRRWPFHILLAVTATVACLAIIGVEPTIKPLSEPNLTWAYSLAYAMGLWSWTFGVIGAGLAFFSGHSRARRYLADASYWIYLVHLPLVMALQVLVAPLDWPWPLKFAAILAAAFAIMLATYQLLVRHSFIGRMLNGKRPRRGKAEPDLQPETL